MFLLLHLCLLSLTTLSSGYADENRPSKYRPSVIIHKIADGTTKRHFFTDDDSYHINTCLQPFLTDKHPTEREINFDSFAKEYVKCAKQRCPKAEEQTRDSKTDWYFGGSSVTEYSRIEEYQSNYKVQNEVNKYRYTKDTFLYDVEFDSKTQRQKIARDDANFTHTSDEDTSDNDGKAYYSQKINDESNVDVSWDFSSSTKVSLEASFGLEAIGLELGGSFSTETTSTEGRTKSDALFKEASVKLEYLKHSQCRVNILGHRESQDVSRKFTANTGVKGWLVGVDGWLLKIRSSYAGGSPYGNFGYKEDKEYDILYLFPVGDMALYLSDYFTRINSHSLFYKLTGSVTKESTVSYRFHFRDSVLGGNGPCVY